MAQPRLTKLDMAKPEIDGVWDIIINAVYIEGCGNSWSQGFPGYLRLTAFVIRWSTRLYSDVLYAAICVAFEPRFLYPLSMRAATVSYSFDVFG
jgi:hypothetical protein